MSTTSPILELTLPAADGSDPFSLADDFLANWAILDASPGVLISTAADLPTLASAQDGRLAYVSDDDYILVWNTVGGWQPPNGIFNGLTVTGPVTNSIDMGGHGLTNYRPVRRVVTMLSSGSPGLDTDTADVGNLLALSTNVTSFSANLTGTPVAGDRLVIWITDDGTARSLTWGAKFASTTVSLPTTTAGTSTRLSVEFEWDTVLTAWRCVRVA